MLDDLGEHGSGIGSGGATLPRRSRASLTRGMLVVFEFRRSDAVCGVDRLVLARVVAMEGRVQFSLKQCNFCRKSIIFHFKECNYRLKECNVHLKQCNFFVI